MQEFMNYAENAGFSALCSFPLKGYTSFKIGGPADVLAFPKTAEQFAGVLQLCRRADIPTFILGNGSNLLVPDDGFRGAVLSTAELRGLRLDSGRIFCGAGEKLKALCMFALEHSLSGLEFAYGIPGSAGGAAFMNAGAYGGEMKDILRVCRCLTAEGEFAELCGETLGLAYRHSAFAENGGVILELELELQTGEPLGIRAKMDDFLSRRREKQPLEFPSAGSIFKRPPGDYAGRLIEACGLRGHAIGGAQVSEKHCGFIVNKSGATCADVLELVAHIRQTVLAQTGVELEPEIRVLDAIPIYEK
ncbi:MAG: UDP-N-acetylmuramate dehydrogenase [Oscillospiraceae bacterium]|nr:UDP-N-acetylmuramate dehydrogenase [Oscillospiraceae bacterium]